MDDVCFCPICNDKLKNVYLNKKTLFPVNKTSDYIQRICATGHNHSILIWTDAISNAIDFLKVSLDSKYSKWLEIDFVNSKCRIICAKNGKYQYIDIDKILDIDFPDMLKIKEKVNFLITFS